MFLTFARACVCVCPAGLKHAGGAAGLHLGVRGRLDGAFRALADLQPTGSISSRAGNTHSSSSTDGQAGASSSLSGLGRVLYDGLRQLMTRPQSGRVANSCSSLAHAGAGGVGMVDTQDLPGLLSVLLPGLVLKEVVELAAWLRAAARQQQQQQGPGPQGMTLRELENAIQGLLEASE